MRAIVTGGAGFIGSHLVDALLARGDNVHVVDNLATGRRENIPPEARFHEADIREPLEPLFDEIEPDVCFHLAAQVDVRVAAEHPYEDAETNLLGTIRALEAAKRRGIQVVLASTGGAIYGERETPAPETAERLPISPYGVSKLASEEYLAAYNRLNGSSHVSLRYANVYGPRQDPHGEAGVVAIFLHALAAGERPRIFGDGSQTRDFVAVSDVVAATLAALGREGGVFNVGTGVETSILELFELCRRIAGVDVEPELASARLGELQRSSVDPGLAARELGWKPERTLEDGLEETWRWIRSS